MNANRRLEEFILKMNLRQNEPGLFDNINAMEAKSYYNDLPISKHNSDNKINNKLACCIDKE